MTRFLKISARVVGIILTLCLLLWLGLLLFVHYNKKTFADIITKQINEQISGTIEIKAIDVTFFKGFPDVAFELKSVTVKDSLWNLHHKDVLNVERAYASISLSSIFKKDAFIKKLTIENGNIYLYTDANGVSNSNIFRKKEKKKDTDKEKNNPLNNVAINNVTLTIKNIPKNKDFLLVFKQCDIRVTHSDTGWAAKVSTETMLKSFAFNVTKGSFLEDMELVTTLELFYSEPRNELSFPLQTLKLDGEPYKLGGTFFLADTPYRFNLDVVGTDVKYNKAVAILTPVIRKKLQPISADVVDEVHVKIIGKMKYLDTPYVKASFAVKNKDLDIPQGTITNASFKGFFLDEVVEGMGHGDANSMVYIEQLTGNYYGIDFKAEDASVTNLKNPLLKVLITSNFALPKLNNIIGENSFRINKGTATVKMDCVLGLSSEYRIPPSINGKIHFDKAAFSYLPRRLNFTNASGDIVFNEADVNINNLLLQSERNKIELNADIKNLLNLYYTAPEKVVINCRVNSNKIDLNEYVSFLDQRAKTPAEKAATNTPAQLRRFAAQFDAIMENSIAKLDVNIREVAYRKFNATDIRAGLVLTQTDIQLNKGHINHADGTLLLSALLKPHENSNTFSVDADLDDVNVKKLFHSFGNFGQTAILEENIEGVISAKINATGGIKYTGDIVPNSLNGKVQFTLKEGRLINFEPLGTIGKIIFFNRDLSNIKVETLSNTLDVANSNIVINPMLIQTNVINIFTEGVYGIPTGTDILIQVPLRNPRKDLNKNNEKMTEKDLKKGVVINLRATDENTGKVKIKLGKKK